MTKLINSIPKERTTMFSFTPSFQSSRPGKVMSSQLIGALAVFSTVLISNLNPHLVSADCDTVVADCDVSDNDNGDWIISVTRLTPDQDNLANSPDAMIDEDNQDFGDFSSNQGRDKISIGGPSLVRVPQHIIDADQSRCGTRASGVTKCYYLYYAHHIGNYIRMSFAEELTGPWTAWTVIGKLRDPAWTGTPFGSNKSLGVLHRKQPDINAVCDNHIASPSVQVRDDLFNVPVFVMYFHCERERDTEQRTWVAVSTNGYTFVLHGESTNPTYKQQGIGYAYASVVQIYPGNNLDGNWLHLSRRGKIGSSSTKPNNAPITMTSGNGLGTATWTERGCDTGEPRCSDNDAFQFKDPMGTDNSRIHHLGLTARGRYLYVFFHRKEPAPSDIPMHIRVARIDMIDNDWKQWGDNTGASPIKDYWGESHPVLMPFTPIERTGDCTKVGKGGSVQTSGNSCDVRDPYIFNDWDGRSYMVYSLAWEFGVNIARIKWSDCDDPDIGPQPGCNQSPTCNAGGPYSIECNGQTNSTHAINASASDSDGDSLTFSWATTCSGGSFSSSTIEDPTLSLPSSCSTTCGVTLTVDDGTATSTCSATVSLVDSTSPTAACTAATVALDNTGNGSTSAQDVNNGSSDTCGAVTVALDQTAFTCPDVGANTVTLTVTDACQNTDTCTATVTVNDNVDPVALCRNVTVELDASGNGSIVPQDVDNGSSDACGISLSLDNTEFDCGDAGPNTVTLTVTDGSSNTDTCTATVTVNDNVAPVALCQNVTVELDASGNGSIVPQDVDNGSSDACGISLSLDITAFDCGDVGPNTVTLTVTDVNGNSSTCDATVTVNDNVDPVALCKDVIVELDASGNGSIVEADVDNGSNDACGIDTLSLDTTAFGCADVGSNTVTLTVTDVNGNSSTCDATITVNDNVDPVALCQDLTVVLDGSGNGSIVPADVDNGSNDACGIDTLSLDTTAFGCADVGANTVTLTVTDVNGNSSTCDATITVEDNEDPVITCPSDIFVESAAGQCKIVVNYDVGLSDNCPGTTFVCTHPSGSLFPVGTTAVTCTATDASGNQSNCSFSVTVNDPPQIVSVTPATQTVQYSDKIVPVVVTATDCGPGSVLTLEFDSADVPNALALSGTADSCSLNASNLVECKWTLSNNDRVLEPEGDYVIDNIKAVDPVQLDGVTLKSSPAKTITIQVKAENATIAFDNGNPVAIQVATDGGNSGMFDLSVDVQELLPELASAGGNLPGDIGLAIMSMTLAPIGPGGGAVGTCTPDNDPAALDYNGVLSVTCSFDNVGVNTYTVEAVLVANGAGQLFYVGSNEDVLVVFDPSLGFTTGGGHIAWPGTGDRTNWGYTMKYNRRRTKIQGSLLLIRHLPDGSSFRIKSNALFGLAIGDGENNGPFGWASFAGKCTYRDPSMVEPEGNHEFVTYVEDHGEPGAGVDRFWLQVFDRDGLLIGDLSMDETAVSNAETIVGGNIVVPH